MKFDIVNMRTGEYRSIDLPETTTWFVTQTGLYIISKSEGEILKDRFTGPQSVFANVHIVDMGILIRFSDMGDLSIGPSITKS